MSDYDPQAKGARCDQCFLQKHRQGGPIGPEIKPGARALFIGEAPSGEDVEEGRPFMGEPGRVLEKGMTAIGVSRSEVSLTHALCCRPPKNDLETLLHKLKKVNTEREKEGQEALPHPVDCCRPRLLKELNRHPNIVTLGKVGTQGILGSKAHVAILELRGGPMTGFVTPDGDFVHDPAGQLKVLPTLHPSFVSKVKRWTRVFRADMARAFRWFNGRLEWKDPTVNRTPSVEDIREWFSRSRKFVAYDVETTMDDPIRNELYCIGFATEDDALVIPWVSKETQVNHYTSREQAEIKELVRDFMRGKTLKVAHNGGYYDRMVVEHHFGVTPSPFLDTILIHRAVESELPHKLGFVGSIYTDVTAWKASHAGTSAQTDRELYEYNAVDCVVTARIFPTLLTAASLRDQVEIAYFDHKLQSWCVGMHKNGLFVDQDRRKEHDVRLKQEAIKWLAELRKIAGNPGINPSSAHQIRKLLFGEWGLTPLVYTKLGDPSTADDVLRMMRLDKTLNEQQVAFLDALRRFRKAIKLRGTYVTKLQPESHLLPKDYLAVDADADPDEKDIKEALKGIVWADGRFHPDYNAHGTTSGRLSSSGPNAQNFPRSLRDIVIAQPGHVLVGADMDQLELRFAAALANATRYLGVFNSGGDPHSETATMLYGDEFTQGDKETKKRIRDFSKRFSYACLYRASPETVHDVIVSVENNKGELIYANMNQRETAMLHTRWLGANPEFEAWWEDDLREYRRQGYLLEPVLGRRRDFLDGEDPNEIANFKCQSGGSAVVHLATKDLIEGPLPFGKWGHGTGLVNQCHDSLTFEVPCNHDKYEGEKAEFGYCPPGCKCEANKAARVIQEAMTKRVDGLDVTFTASAKIGRRWSET